MQELVNSVNKVEKIVLGALSSSDRDILAAYVSEQVALSTNEKVKDGLTKILKQIKMGWTNYDESPQALSVKYFEKNIFTLTSFQYRVAFLQETADKVRKIFTDSFYSVISFDKTTLFIIDRTLLGFQDILVCGMNFMGKYNDDSYYESHTKEHEVVQKVHAEFVKRDCRLLRELFEEL